MRGEVRPLGPWGNYEHDLSYEPAEDFVESCPEIVERRQWAR